MKHMLCLAFLAMTFFTWPKVLLAQPLLDEDDNRPDFSEEMGSDIESWCQRTEEILNRYQNLAMNHYQQEKYKMSYLTLIQGLQAAQQQVRTPFQSSLTARMISRGLLLARVASGPFDFTTPEKKFEQKSVLAFLTEYYKFVKWVSSSVDVPYFGTGHCSPCANDRLWELEQRMIDVAKAEIRLVQQELTTIRPQDRLVVPLLKAKTYLQFLETMVGFGISDLKDNLFGYRFTCSVEQLKDVRAHLRQYLNGYGPYQNDVQAVNASYEEIDNALYSFGCH